MGLAGSCPELKLVESWLPGHQAELFSLPLSQWALLTRPFVVQDATVVKTWVTDFLPLSKQGFNAVIG